MYNTFYKLKRDPFRLNPDPDFLYMTSQHREAFAGLVYSVSTHPGLTVLVGEAGTGKTTLLYTLVAVLEKRRFLIAMCTNPTLTRAEFYDALLTSFGVECSSALKSRQLLAFQETLTRNRADGRPSVLIVDEAHRLSAELLEEIRLLMNLETPREKLLEIIMAGQPELSDTLRRPELRQLKQRVSCFCKLQPFSLAEVREYLSHRLNRAGLAEQNLFPEPVIELICEYTHGIPRLINTLCDTALRTGLALQSRQVTVAILREAARDLELDLVPPPAVPDAMAAAIIGAAEGVPERASAAQEKAPQNGNTERMPLDGYAARQKTVSFLASLMDRWR